MEALLEHRDCAGTHTALLEACVALPHQQLMAYKPYMMDNH